MSEPKRPYIYLNPLNFLLKIRVSQDIHHQTLEEYETTWTSSKKETTGAFPSAFPVLYTYKGTKTGCWRLIFIFFFLDFSFQINPWDFLLNTWIPGVSYCWRFCMNPGSEKTNKGERKNTKHYLTSVTFHADEISWTDSRRDLQTDLTTKWLTTKST
jgi:hypothetical protein